MRMLVSETERAWQALGTISYGTSGDEDKSLKFRRSLYMRAIRPGFGLSPKYLEIVLGKTVARDVKRGTPLTWDLLA
jgi:N-acetylneuraminate synthase